GRESYRGARGIGREGPTIVRRDLALLRQSREFRRAAATETRKYVGKAIYRDAAKLVPMLRPEDLERSDKVGIRPQLVHWPTRQLVMDFVLITQATGTHVLNAVSPAFTSSMAFARYATATILEGRASRRPTRQGVEKESR
ncbi:MAG: L-2-hydroxyglutarate oxidase, partial [Actinomycetota bacterium]|nr:L-2-hydroxyglutarate oxidase [Actinomycetota bacterium]